MEVFTGTKPDYTKFHTFVSLCFHKILTAIEKFEPGAHMGVFLGFSTGQKVYKILDLETNKIIISREVEFHENVFPFVENGKEQPTEISEHYTENELSMTPQMTPTTIATRNGRQVNKP